MFGCPLAGDPESATSLLCEVAGRESAKRSENTAFVIGGLIRGGAMYRAVVSLQNRSRVWREFPGTSVMMIDLDNGLEAWWKRRSKKFRRSLGMAGAFPEENSADGIEFIDVSPDPPEALFERILTIQQRTYKWREGTDIFQIPAYTAFYRRLLEDLHGSGGLRVLIARRNGVDLAHIFGGVRGTIYRGLQMSYIEEARDLGLGNRLQLENLRRCAAEGVRTYDLGMHAPYKERWADRLEERVGVLWMG
jgi:CelD/BcsL family acetyltransferase involved in cellulose biosynthesis